MTGYTPLNKSLDLKCSCIIFRDFLYLIVISYAVHLMNKTIYSSMYRYKIKCIPVLTGPAGQASVQKEAFFGNESYFLKCFISSATRAVSPN